LGLPAQTLKRGNYAYAKFPAQTLKRGNSAYAKYQDKRLSVKISVKSLATQNLPELTFKRGKLSVEISHTLKKFFKD